MMKGRSFGCLPYSLKLLLDTLSCRYDVQPSLEGILRYLRKSLDDGVHDVLHDRAFRCSTPLEGQCLWCCIGLCLLQPLQRLKQKHLQI